MIPEHASLPVSEIDSATRAARLSLVSKEVVAPEGVGGWRFRIVGHGREIQLRNKRLPHLRLDMTTTEAHDLASSIGMALDEASLMPVVRVSPWARFVDWFARWTWRRAHRVEQEHALAELAKEFRESKGGW